MARIRDGKAKSGNVGAAQVDASEQEVAAGETGVVVHCVLDVAGDVGLAEVGQLGVVVGV